jgi:hypothetical protein
MVTILRVRAPAMFAVLAVDHEHPAPAEVEATTVRDQGSTLLQGETPRSALPPADRVGREHRLVVSHGVLAEVEMAADDDRPRVPNSVGRGAPARGSVRCGERDHSLSILSAAAVVEEVVADDGQFGRLFLLHLGSPPLGSVRETERGDDISPAETLVAREVHLPHP